MVVDVEQDRRTTILKALAEPVRWRIVQRLAQEELCGCHLVDDLDIAQPLVSHHLKVLREAGIVESERFKQWLYYRIVPDALATLADELADVAKAQDTATRNRRPCC